MKLSKGTLASSAVTFASAVLTVLTACSSDDGAPSSSSGSSSASSSSGTTTSSSSTSSSGGTDASASTDGGSTSSSGGQDGGKKGLAETCTKNEDCESNACFMGNQGSYCSLPCTQANAATVCVAPFNGVCNNQGYCRKP